VIPFARMPHLFSPLRIGRLELRNRIVMSPMPSGFANESGFINERLVEYYRQRAAGGVSLIITEPLLVITPGSSAPLHHLALYHDYFIPRLREICTAAHQFGARLLVTLDALAAGNQHLPPHQIAEAFSAAAWRALTAGCDGFMLSAADGGILHSLLSPLRAATTPAIAPANHDRLRLPLLIIDAIRDWPGKHSLIGFRLIAEEFAPGGLTLQDTRLIARRLTTAGIRLLDITVDRETAVPLARFPGWAIPLAGSIKRTVSDVPIIGSGQLSDPLVADGSIRDGSVDLVMLGAALRSRPDWPRLAYARLWSDMSHNDANALVLVDDD
jgi:2,4-dienoyl-CoA reductase-like NADH-dependent reductase (Old Yellow Enzyme family)